MPPAIGNVTVTKSSPTGGFVDVTVTATGVSFPGSNVDVQTCEGFAKIRLVGGTYGSELPMPQIAQSGANRTLQATFMMQQDGAYQASVRVKWSVWVFDGPTESNYSKPPKKVTKPKGKAK